MMGLRLRLLALVLILSGCAHSIHQVHVGDFVDRALIEGEPIHAQTEQFVVLGFVSDTEYVDQARVNLERQCDGEIAGITTQYSTSLGFLSWTHHLLMQGLCMNPKSD